MITVNGANFKQEVLESELPVVVDFQAPWCGYCKRLAPTVGKMEADLAGKVKVGTIDIDNDPELAEQFQVMTIPTLILFKDGKAASSVVNPSSRNVIDEWLSNNGVG